MKLFNIVLDVAAVATALACVSTPAFALNGCADSPENSTLLLALLGVAAALTPKLRRRLRKRD